jgi:hypothetical protein
LKNKNNSPIIPRIKTILIGINKPPINFLRIKANSINNPIFDVLYKILYK